MAEKAMVGRLSDRVSPLESFLADLRERDDRIQRWIRELQDGGEERLLRIRDEIRRNQEEYDRKRAEFPVDTADQLQAQIDALTINNRDLQAKVDHLRKCNRELTDIINAL